jgi:hypothetical protein
MMNSEGYRGLEEARDALRLLVYTLPLNTTEEELFVSMSLSFSLISLYKATGY